MPVSCDSPRLLQRKRDRYGRRGYRRNGKEHRDDNGQGEHHRQRHKVHDHRSSDRLRRQIRNRRRPAGGHDGEGSGQVQRRRPHRECGKGRGGRRSAGRDHLLRTRARFLHRAGPEDLRRRAHDLRERLRPGGTPIALYDRSTRRGGNPRPEGWYRYHNRHPGGAPRGRPARRRG